MRPRLNGSEGSRRIYESLEERGARAKKHERDRELSRW